MKKKLIIWDFDGVITDSEHLWVKNWAAALHELKGIKLDKTGRKHYLEGKANKTKMELLSKDFPDLEFDDEFWQRVRSTENKIIDEGLSLTLGVEDIFKDSRFEHCIATGATPEKNSRKLITMHIDKYFPPEKNFTAYEVEHGKPAPDLFLYAAKKMGYNPQDCVVIEDSIVGIMAGVAAGIKTIAYIGATGNNNPEYAEKCLKLGADAVFSTMSEVHAWLQNFALQK